MRSARTLALLVVALASCNTPVLATVSWGPAAPIDQGHTLFVTAKRQVARLEQSLVEAGFEVTRRAGNADYLLRVDVGSGRGSRACGPSSNVRYILSQGRKRILVLKGRGRTGACKPNLFDDLSRLLESYFVARVTNRASR